MSKNTNRDYLIIVDVKSSTIREFNKLEFYINDKESHNIFVQLVIKESHDIINKYAPIDDPNLYELAMNIVKPTNEDKRITGKLISLEDGLYEFKLPQDCCDKVGTYVCELETIYNSRITNSNRIKYRIKKSVLNDLDGIVDAPGYPIVIQLLDKLSDIEQYEEDRRANEVARQLAEQQRQQRFNELEADVTDSIQAMDNKVIDVENRVSIKEQAVDKLIVDTKADIDEYKVAKDQEINNAITAQDSKIDTAISNQNDRIALVENNNVAQDNRLNVLENKNQQQDNRLDVVEAKNVEQDNRLNDIEAIDVAQNTRLDAIENKNTEQDDRLLDVEKVNSRQDIDIKCLYGASQTIDVTKEGNSIYLQNSTIGYTLIDEIQGNTLVNCNKEADKELILNGNINTQGYSNVTLTEGVDGGLVDVALEGNTMVNVCDQKDSVALPFNRELTYLYTNTQYAVQFVSDAVSKADITLGGAKLLNQDVVIGINRVAITTPETLADNKLIIDGVGANISEVVVTEATDKDFGHFEGMKSVGECEDLEIVSSNSDGTLTNTQTLTHEPLRAVGEIKDKYVLIDGKWYIERNCAEVVFDGSEDERWIIQSSNTTNLCSQYYIAVEYGDTGGKNIALNYINDTFKKLGTKYGEKADKEGMYTGWSGLYINIFNSKLSEISNSGIKQWLQSNLVTVIYQLQTPTYEPIDYNPLEVYSNTTHISNNSTIPCNMTIKNTGYNCLLKPSTTYTVSSNLGLNVVATPSTLTEDCLRFMDTDTSDVTTMKDVLILEGDWTTKADLIPANFGGIESAFEQEYDEGKGKYKVKVRVQNEDATKENYIEFYINEPLRGIGDTKDKVYVKDDKVVVERKCGQREYQDGDFGTYLTDKVNTVYQLAEPTYEEVEYNDVKLFIESFKNSTLSYNSNVPVTSKLYYSYSVPIVDKVTQTASITDEQDSMIIDLATQCAVMEMMLM